MSRQRDYAAEYARRKQVEVERAAAQGRPFDLSKARGHTNTARDQARTLFRRLSKHGVYDENTKPGEEKPALTWADVITKADNTSWDEVLAALEMQQQSIRHALGKDADNYGYGRTVYEGRNINLPIEFYWYHVD